MKSMKISNTKREIRGLRTVNCGEILEVTVEDPLYEGQPIIVEVLRPEKHNPTHQIVCYYYIDNKTGHKVEVTIHRNLETGNIGSEVYFFDSKESIQYYTSRNYDDISKLPKKYLKIAVQLNKALYKVFGIIKKRR